MCPPHCPLAAAPQLTSCLQSLRNQYKQILGFGFEQGRIAVHALSFFFSLSLSLCIAFIPGFRFG